MSFLIDPPWLYANGRALAATAADDRQRDRLAAATLGVFLVTSISLYLDKGWTKPIWRLCRARRLRNSIAPQRPQMRRFLPGRR